MDDFHPLELDSLLHAFPSLKLKTFPQTRVIGDYNECKKFVVNTIIMMVFPSAKLVFRFRLSFNQILSPGLQLTPGFSSLMDTWENPGIARKVTDIWKFLGDKIV